MAPVGGFTWCCFHRLLINRSAAILRFSESLQYFSLRHSQCLDIAVIKVTSIVFCISYGIFILCWFLSFSDSFRHDCQTATPSEEEAECLTISRLCRYAPVPATLACSEGCFAPGRPCECVQRHQVFRPQDTMQSICRSTARMLSCEARMILERIPLRRMLLFALCLPFCFSDC